MLASIAKDSTDALLWFELSEAYTMNGQDPEALRAIRKSDQLNPGDVKTLIVLADLHRALGHIDSSETIYLHAKQISPDNSDVYLGLGVIYSIKKQYDSAGYCFRKGLEIKPFAPEGHSNYANYLDITGKTDSSIIQYGIAIAQDPATYIPYMNRGRIYTGIGNFDEALQDYDLAVDHSHGTGEPYIGRSRCYEKMGNKTMALRDAQKAISLGVKVDENYIDELKP